MPLPDEVKSGQASYFAMKDLAEKHGVYEQAKENKINRLMASGKSRDEINAKPQKEDLEKALEDANVDTSSAESSNSYSSPTITQESQISDVCRAVFSDPIDYL